MILNKSENKINYIQSFICNIVEINTELIKMLPNFENLKDDIFIRYIVSSKQIYNLALEIYFSINDLYNVKIFITNKFIYFYFYFIMIFILIRLTFRLLWI
jgi:hypothetical protein